MVALDQCVRSDCVVTLTIRSAPRGLGAPPSPRSAFPCFFFFAGGDFFKIEWAETGRGRASSKEEAVGENANSILSLVSFLSLVVRPAHGAHPRHPPRTFPLGLLGPRCLGLALFLALPHCGAGARAPFLFGGRKCSSPQRRSPPRSGLLEPRLYRMVVVM